MKTPQNKCLCNIWMFPKLMSGKAHPPPWLSNDEKLEEYLHNFKLSIQGNFEEIMLDTVSQNGFE